MNYNDTLLSAELVIKSGDVPLIIGESGIGKTALAREIAEKNNYYCISIDANLLKEGEIGGLPVVEEYVVIEDGREVKRKRTSYAIHNKLQEIEKVRESDKDRTILLFIDEINRSDHSVQQELMNIILNKEINGYKLPEKVKVLAAMNPSSKYEEFENTDYMVVDMDEAQENRFVWLIMESDPSGWLHWGINNGIHSKVLEFISTFPEFLHSRNSKEMIKATPRSWQRVSQNLVTFEESEKLYSKAILFNVVKGSVGAVIAQEFLSYLESSKNPLITPEEFFHTFAIEDLKNKILTESHSRLYLTAKNALIYLDKNTVKDEYVERFSKALRYFPVDLKIGIMKEIKDEYNYLYKSFIDNDTFINGYFEVAYNEKPLKVLNPQVISEEDDDFEDPYRDA